MAKIGKNGIVYNGKTYPLVFNLNVMELIQEEYKTVEAWGELTDIKSGKEVDVKALKFGITAMLNEGVDEYNDTHEEKRDFFEPKVVGRIISELGMQEMAKKMNKTVIDSSVDENSIKNE